MELRKFISTALVDIVQAVKDAQEELGSNHIVPGNNTDFKSVEHRIAPIQAVSFEITVGVDETRGSEGRLGVVNSFIGAGLSGKSGSETKHANVLKFCIPVLLPTSRRKEKE